MSQLIINNYIAEIEKYIQYGGDKKETSIRRAFANLLTAYCKPHDLLLVDEIEYTTKLNTRVVPDGTIKDALRLTHGYWEAKDEHDIIDDEIALKFKKGYPNDNILFEDSKTAVLVQNGVEAQRCDMRNTQKLDHLIKQFVEFERPELQSFRQAISQFKEDMPAVLGALRELIDSQAISNASFKKSLEVFLKLCQDNINKDIVLDDAREMLIQHILTEDIFYTVFNDTQFHRENNIARELQKVADTFFTGATKKNTLKRLESYYGAIKQSASGIANHHEKQKFLKAIYENFYKVYNPKLADRLGVVYTPNEIVRFMVESTESLVHKHFNKLLHQKGVEILDPATGTGTFITELIEHFKGNKKDLEYKYKNELHCNEVAILPYYIANLNIEFSYSQIMGEYAEFPHICFVDTLDNLGFAQKHQGAQDDLFSAGMTAENTERVKKQNAQKISVIIGNPPYNANQKNENDDNKNRNYPNIDRRIKDTYLAKSSAQKTKLYEPLVRFLRWSSDRINEQGIVAFIINRAFIDKMGYDGFRKTVAEEFNEIFILDLGGDWREGNQIGGGNVFGISIGVAIIFMVKNPKYTGCSIYYKLSESITTEDKLRELVGLKFNEIEFTSISPDANGVWINQSDNNFNDLLPLANEATRNNSSGMGDSAIFKFYSLGISTNRDEWSFDVSKNSLASKVKYFLTVYKDAKKSNSGFVKTIKWSETLKQKFKRGESESYDSKNIKLVQYRPFTKRYLYDSYLFVDRPGHKKHAFPSDLALKNLAIAFTDTGSQKPFMVGAADCSFDLHFVGSAAGTSYFSYFRYDSFGNFTDNITDWGLAQFQQHYASSVIARSETTKQSSSSLDSHADARNDKAQDCHADARNDGREITKLAIFHYVYAVMHDPIYREKYALNLKREFPRVPFYTDFWVWADWGSALMDAHIGYETAEPYALTRTNKKVAKPKAKLKADKENGLIILDEATILSGVPASAWDYKLGNRSALEWVLDQYKESKPKDPTIREKFNTYQFADYKEHVIDLLMRVCTVSVATQAITEAMVKVERN